MSLLSVGAGQDVMAAGMQGGVTVLRHARVSVHSYLAPADGLLVTSQIIETPGQIVIVDAQYTRAYAQEVLQYAQGLGKPISRIYLSHSHPDHWSGLAVFAGIPAYTLPEVRNEIAARSARGGGEPVAGGNGSDIREIPPEVIRSGSELIDGVRFQFERVGVAEGSAHLLIRLPDINTTIAQDLVYNGVHLYAGQDGFDRWASVLRDLRAQEGDATVLAGHGAPTDRSGIDRTLSYLEDLARFRATAKDGEALKRQLLEKYPDYLGGRLIDISLPRLYPAGK